MKKTSDRFSLEILAMLPACNDGLSHGSRFVFGGEDKMKIQAIFGIRYIINSLTRRIAKFVFVTTNLVIYRRRVT